MHNAVALLPLPAYWQLASQHTLGLMTSSQQLILDPRWMNLPCLVDGSASLPAGLLTIQSMVRSALKYIQEKHSWWQRNNGSDHLWIWTQVSNSIKLLGSLCMTLQLKVSP